MPYRRPYKRARYGKRDKYSVQQKAFNTTLGAGATVGAVIVPPTNVEGMRKVKHITVNVTEQDSRAERVQSSGGQSSIFLRGQH